MNKNEGYVCGVVKDAPVYLYSKNGESFYAASIIAERTSGTEDIIPVIASERTDGFNFLSTGDFLYAGGEIRTRNEKTDGKKKLRIYLFASYICPMSMEAVGDGRRNEFVFDGAICRKPNLRQTGKGGTIADVVMAVNGRKRASYLPCIVFERNARYISRLPVGTTLRCRGRLQSRNFQKCGQIHTVNEMAVTEFEALGDRTDEENQ